MRITRKKRQYLFMFLGVCVLILAGILQTSSYFTPWLADNPTLLYLFSAGGLIFMALFTIILLLVGFFGRISLCYLLAFIQTIGLLFVLYSEWGWVFQFTIAGLTIGGGLLVLGGVSPHLIRKSQV